MGLSVNFHVFGPEAFYYDNKTKLYKEPEKTKNIWFIHLKINFMLYSIEKTSPVSFF